MIPIKFTEQNVIFAENQPEYIPLPAYRSNLPEGYVISCWKLSWKERLSILLNGKLWMGLMMFGKPLTPSLLTTNKDILFQQTELNEKKSK